MSRSRRTRFVPKSYESAGSNLSANLYVDMLTSPAWMKMSKGAQVLYIYMKLQLYGAKPIPEYPPEAFYFNTALVTKTYGLYTNLTQYRKDRQQLIDNGFIEVVYRGYNTRTKDIYKLSDKWKAIL